MRIERSFTRKSGIKEPKSKYYIVPEGDRTEMMFFCGIRDNAEELKIKKLIEIIPLENEENEHGQSHPKRKLINFKETVKNEKILFDEKIDKVCFVFDRDPQNFSEKQFEEIVKECNEKDYYILCITNPTFELYLLMHSNKVFELDRGEMLKNEKRGNKRFLEIEVSKEFGHGKTKLDFEKFKNKIRMAIKNEKEFCEDINGLKTELGSNIGEFLDSIIENDFEE